MLAVHLRQPSGALWALLEVALGVCWLFVIWRNRRLANVVSATHQPIFRSLDLLGACSVGFGTTLSILTGNQLAVTAGVISAAAFAGEACVVNFGRPRLLAAMLAVGILPAIVTCLATPKPVMIFAGLAIGLYVGCMLASSMTINRLLVATLRAERENDQRARHDRLTGLLNRAGLEREFALIRADRGSALLSCFFVDLDHFKKVNDRYGHGVGDQVLRLVSEGLLELCGADGIAARIGGDEFVVVTQLDLVRPAEFGLALLAAVTRVNTLIDLDGIAVSASIGATQARAGSADLTAIMSAADIALYCAKDRGGNCYFAGEMSQPS